MSSTAIISSPDSNSFTTASIAANPLVSELNIGHAIIADAVFLGLEAAIREIKAIMLAARSQAS